MYTLFNELYNYFLKCLFYLSCHQQQLTTRPFYVNVSFPFYICSLLLLLLLLLLLFDFFFSRNKHFIVKVENFFFLHKQTPHSKCEII